jgi:hypothetical protein
MSRLIGFDLVKHAEKLHKHELDVSGINLRKATAAEAFTRTKRSIKRNHAETRDQIDRLQDLMVPAFRIKHQLGRVEGA